MSTQARLEKSASSLPQSERLTRSEKIAWKLTETDIRLPDEPRLAQGYTLQVGGDGWYDPVKSTLDSVAATVLLLLSLPFVLISALIVRLTSHGPAFYTQMRLGRGGKPYVIYKLRSMYHDCERFSGIRWSSRGDSRVTPFGWFLRKSHIDELPQLWNVLKGDMSLIGPRPERPELVVTLEKALPLYRDRLLVKPGLTGLAQIQLPPDTDLESVRQKLILDRVYVQNRSFWFDMKIYVATVCYLAGMPFEMVRLWFSLPHKLRDEKQATSQKLPVIKSNPVREPYPLPMLDQA